MLRQLGAGIMHPWIHLGFGIEFEIEDVVAEALAECAVHEDELGEYYGLVDQRRKELGSKVSGLVVARVACVVLSLVSSLRRLS